MPGQLLPAGHPPERAAHRVHLRYRLRLRRGRRERAARQVHGGQDRRADRFHRPDLQVPRRGRAVRVRQGEARPGRGQVHLLQRQPPPDAPVLGRAGGLLHAPAHRQRLVRLGRMLSRKQPALPPRLRRRRRQGGHQDGGQPARGRRGHLPPDVRDQVQEDRDQGEDRRVPAVPVQQGARARVLAAVHLVAVQPALRGHQDHGGLHGADPPPAERDLHAHVRPQRVARGVAGPLRHAQEVLHSQKLHVRLPVPGRPALPGPRRGRAAAQFRDDPRRGRLRAEARRGHRGGRRGGRGPLHAGRRRRPPPVAAVPGGRRVQGGRPEAKHQRMVRVRRGPQARPRQRRHGVRGPREGLGPPARQRRESGPLVLDQERHRVRGEAQEGRRAPRRARRVRAQRKLHLPRRERRGLVQRPLPPGVRLRQHRRQEGAGGRDMRLGGRQGRRGRPQLHRLRRHVPPGRRRHRQLLRRAHQGEARRQEGGGVRAGLVPQGRTGLRAGQGRRRQERVRLQGGRAGRLRCRVPQPMRAGQRGVAVRAAGHGVPAQRGEGLPGDEAGPGQGPGGLQRGHRDRRGPQDRGERRRKGLYRDSRRRRRKPRHGHGVHPPAGAAQGQPRLQAEQLRPARTRPPSQRGERERGPDEDNQPLQPALQLPHRLLPRHRLHEYALRRGDPVAVRGRRRQGHRAPHERRGRQD